MESPYLISGIPMPSTFVFVPESSFSYRQKSIVTRITNRCVSLIINWSDHNLENCNTLMAFKPPVYGNFHIINWSQKPYKKKFSLFLMWLLTFDDRKQKEVVLMSALSRSTRCRPFSSVRPRYLPVVIWQSRNGCPQHVCLSLQLRNNKSTVFFCCFQEIEQYTAFSLSCLLLKWQGSKQGTHNPNSILGQWY